MQQIARRSFCGTALIGFPALCLHASNSETALDRMSEGSDLILDNLADEIARIAAEGATSGFRAEHLRRCANLVRIFDARIAEKGSIREADRRLNVNDFHKHNPAVAARNATEYCRKHGIQLNEDDLRTRLAVDTTSYRDMKLHIHKMGGLAKFHAAIADALERKATEQAAAVIKGDVILRNGVVAFSGPKVEKAEFVNAQYDINTNVVIGMSSQLDCLCKALMVESAILAILCFTVCPPCCAAAGILAALERLLSAFGACQASSC